MSEINFTPVRGTEEKIFASNIGFNDGYVYFATDTGKIYIDYTNADGEKISRAVMGGSSGGSGNSGIYYASKTLTSDEKSYPTVSFPITTIEGDTYPAKDDLIINSTDGCFYRVTNVDIVAAAVIADRLTISGGGSGSVTTLAEDVEIVNTKDFETYNLINDMSQEISFIIHSAKNSKGNVVSNKATVTWTLAYTEDGGTNYTTYKTEKFTQAVEEEFSIDVGKYAKESASSKFIIKVTQSNTDSSASWEAEFSTSELSLELPNSFSNLNYVSCNDLALSCVISGDMTKQVEYYFDDLDTPFYTVALEANETSVDPVIVSNYVSVSYGYHTVAIRLFQLLNGKKAAEVDPIQYEVATYTSEDETQAPIIWIGDYKDTYYSYETVQIPFRVYDPKNVSSVWVTFSHNGKELENSPQEITSATDWAYLEISDADLDADLTYTISCGDDDRMSSRDIEFKVTQDPDRKNFKVRSENLVYSLTAIGSGRSNSESESHRKLLTNNGISAIFENFNWYNNGWVRDDENKTCIRISNGASLRIPYGNMTFSNASGNALTDTSHTIELMFKIRNIQDYSNLIHTITRYKEDSDLYAEFYDTETNTYKTSYTNYDAFLANYLKTHVVTGHHDDKGNEIAALSYDDLIYSSIEKQINLSNVACGYYSGTSKSVTGLCLGPQDAFFSNGVDTISVSYVEDEIVTLSLVSQYSTEQNQNLIYIYINGVLTGVTRSNKSPFYIGSTTSPAEIVFNSEYCDIDLYKVRVYNAALNVNDIVMNYAADLSDVDIYDQNGLAVMNSSINEYQFSYDKMIKYNNEHPDAPLMPYIIFDTSLSGEDKLSYTKDVNVDVGVEFVNTGLELAYSNGELEALAKADGLWSDGATTDQKAAAVKKYYQYHCPSFVSSLKTADGSCTGANMAVQGTSSEFYPRRNYKIKTKNTWDDDGEERTHIFLNRGPFAEDYEADRVGVSANEYILSTGAYDANETYYSDDSGDDDKKVEFTASNPYQYNKYYIKNPDYVKVGKESTRQKYWYLDNYVAGTNKWTMKIDFMESSGSYNMGFANLVANAYSKHPLEDYNAASAFVTEKSGSASEITSYDSSKTYYYLSHKGEWKAANEDGNVQLTSEEDFNKGPFLLAAAQGITKILGGKKDKYPTTEVTELTEDVLASVKTNIEGTITDNSSADTFQTAFCTYEKGFNKWFLVTEASYPSFTIPNTKSYRTSVEGFRALAFHKKSDGTYQFIGMYNILLDKGSDECYGFKPDKTTGSSPLQKYVNNKAVSDIAECWEFENNSRTYCSFRDPLKRKDLSFDYYNGASQALSSTGSAPIVIDSFEYRYNAGGDALDYVYDPEKNQDKLTKALSLYPATGAYDITTLAGRSSIVFERYKNWERACQWVWSTCTDEVESAGSYEEAIVYKQIWTANTFYVWDTDADKYVIDSNSSYDADITYYEPSTEDSSVYINAFVADPTSSGDNLFIGTNKTKYYTKVEDAYNPCSEDDEFNDSTTYYILVSDSEAVLASKCDRLVELCADEAFDENKVYYNYDGTKQCGSAVTIAEVTAETYEPNKYYEATTVSYGTNHTHSFDTKEYRADKFINELEKHFNLEYMATYFVMTEVFECYDSRGKNCMMASWGPQEENGDYIWYPIFYDIDTQLGVNNTGIPSFEYNVDATIDGNYSTSDSVLWNNFYTYFKDSAIIAKYKHLKGVTAGVSWIALKNPPIRSIDNIENWYSTNPDTTGCLAMRGTRPLVAKNLDEYYKYITITNPGTTGVEYKTGVCGHISSDDTGTYTFDGNCAYFYMLQGDRSLSRRQFIENRLEYIDSWLNQGNYKRGGANRIRGRVAANNINTAANDKISDHWVETKDSTYYTDAAFGEEGSEKRHLFDAEYWLTLTPAHSSYVTLGDDNEAYPSQKYDGVNPLKFNIDAIEKGVRQSEDYPEQLLYIYGLNQLQDLGDMSNLYWQEFEISGDASKLTSLKLGYDGIATETLEDGTIKTYNWYNKKMNYPSIPAGKKGVSSEYGMPLLKEVNLSNIQLSETSSKALDFMSCEKLKNFRATGSNFEQFSFADGVALNTLYLPSSIRQLKLVEARLLTNLITSYNIPIRNTEGNLVADKGLYIEGLFDGTEDSLISSLTIKHSGLGYDSYKLLKQYYKVRSARGEASDLTMTDVQWAPYTVVGEEDTYDSTASYYYDNGHFGLEPYSYNVDTWNTKVVNGELYIKDTTVSDDIINLINDDSSDTCNFMDMFNNFADSSSELFREITNTNIPNITGIVYINNTTTYKETDIRNTLQTAFPDLTFFFANIEKSYTAKFLVMDEDEGENGTYTILAQQSIDSGWFDKPANLTSKIKKIKPNNDFSGWATTNSLSAEIIYSDTIDNWTADSPDVANDPTKYDYYFYAICPIHKWTVTYCYTDGTTIATENVANGSCPVGPETEPWLSDSSLDLKYTNKFLGYSKSKSNTTNLVDLSKLVISNDTTLYAIFDSGVEVYNNIHLDYFTGIPSNFTDPVTGEGFNGCTLSLNKKVKGKITIPATFTINGTSYNVISIDETFNPANNGAGITHIFFGQNEDGSTNILEIGPNAFATSSSGTASALKYFEVTDSLRVIGNYAFQFCRYLETVNWTGANLCELGAYAFNGAFGRQQSSNTTFIIGSKVSIIGEECISYNNATSPGTVLTTLWIGQQDNPSDLTLSDLVKNAETNEYVHICSENSGKGYFTSVILYTTNTNNTLDALKACFYSKDNSCGSNAQIIYS